jgi:uncharacterized protein YbjT (DUF2867 family)
MKLRVLITGVTGMVGEGVLMECLDHPDVVSVTALTRKSYGLTHPKFSEILHPDFFDLSSIEGSLIGFDTCFFCLGVSSIGMKENEYRRLTYDLTMHSAQTLARLNPDMTFCYISGMATDSTEQGRQMWARVKGKTENDLMKLPFKTVFCFRPGFLKASAGMKNVLRYYKYFDWLYPIIRFIMPSSISTLRELGLSMIRVASHGYHKQILEVKDIVALSKENN